MGSYRLGAGLGVALLLGTLPGVPAPRAAAQGTAPGGLAFSTVHGKLEMVNESVNGVAVVSDEGQRMAWQFDKTVIEKLKGFKPETWRYRIGIYRFFYILDDKEKAVYLVAADTRQQSY